MDLLDLDGCSEICVKNWDDWEAFFKSSEYAEALGPDCSDFMDMPIKAMAGYDNIIFDPTVSGSGGKDGIMKA
ncbi:hypothetical protein BJ546DRAFT_1068907 [Cryomyces antarcticus]